MVTFPLYLLLNFGETPLLLAQSSKGAVLTLSLHAGPLGLLLIVSHPRLTINELLFPLAI